MLADLICFRKWLSVEVRAGEEGSGVAGIGRGLHSKWKWKGERCAAGKQPNI
jgi:hypothetical protein